MGPFRRPALPTAEPGLGMRPLTLSFTDAVVERDFGADYFRRFLPQMRLAFVQGAIIMSVASALDFLLVDEGLRFFPTNDNLLYNAVVLLALINRSLSSETSRRR